MTRIIKTQDEKRESTVNNAVWFWPVLVAFPTALVLLLVALFVGESAPLARDLIAWAAVAAFFWFLFGLYKMVMSLLTPTVVVQREEYVSLPDGTDTNTLPSSTYQNTSHTTH